MTDKTLSPEEFESACREVGQMVQDEFKRIVAEAFADGGAALSEWTEEDERKHPRDEGGKGV